MTTYQDLNTAQAVAKRDYLARAVEADIDIGHLYLNFAALSDIILANIRQRKGEINGHKVDIPRLEVLASEMRKRRHLSTSPPLPLVRLYLNTLSAAMSERVEGFQGYAARS